MTARPLVRTLSVHRRGAARGGEGAARVEARKWPLSGACHDHVMGTRERPGDLGADDARAMYQKVAREIRQARIAGGWSQEAVARAAGLSRAQLYRLEKGKLQDPGLKAICRASRAVGLSVSLTQHPTGERLRDTPQLRLAEEFAAIPASPIILRREIPLPIPGDLRAWDLLVSDGRLIAFVECETRLGDIQALARRLALKLRDDPRSGVLILVVRSTAHNRRVLAEHREALRAQFPLDGAAIARALRAGRIPSASGILLVQ
jgi:transcriptional regulator with XRE-family HTH domain